MLDFRNLPIRFVIPLPVMVLLGIGVLTVLSAIALGAWWVISHLQWVS